VILVLARLQALTLKGRVIRSFRLLRQPKYLVGAIAGIAWIGLWVVRPMLLSGARFGAASWAHSVAGLTPLLHRVAAVMVTVGLPLPWLLPWARLGLPFREAELTMLLQAPLTRRDVIQYGLLKSELGVLISALAVSLLFSGRGLSASGAASFLGTWLVFEFLHLNGKWRALILTGARGRQLRLTIGLLAFYAVLFFALVPFVASVTAGLAGIDRAQVVAALAALEWPKLLVALTTPAWWLTAPMFAAGGSAYLVSLIPLILAVVLQRELVLRSKARFEESALEQAKLADSKTSPARAAVKRVAWTRGHHPFALPSAGSPELAVIWKNTIRISRLPWTWSLGIGAAVLVGVAVLPAVLGLPDWTFGVPVGIGVSIFIFQPILGGMSWNNDLRSELMHLELVRTWPVAAPRFLLAEVVSPALLSFTGAMFGAGMALASLFGNHLRHALTGEATQLHLLPRSGELLGVPNMWAAVLLFLACMPLAAAASFVSSAVQNMGVLLMPAWMAHSVDRGRGVAAFGQRLVTTVALALTFLLALLPSALLIALALVVQRLLGIPWSAWELPFWGILGAIPPFVLGWLLLRFAAPLWERLDASTELLEIGR
jgi:hypothetical protein